MGLARRAVLEAGGRFVAGGLVSEPSEAWCLEPHELAALLRGEAGPSAADIAGRVRLRTEQIALEERIPLQKIEKPANKGRLTPDPLNDPHGERLILTSAVELPPKRR